MHLPFIGHKEAPEAPVFPSEVAAADAIKYPAGSLAITGAVQASEGLQSAQAPEATQPENVVELPTPEATVAEAPHEPVDTDHQLPAHTA